MKNQAPVPCFVDRRNNRTVESILSISLGVLVLSICAQIAIPLPWTPVPITGQTFGVAIVAMLWGANNGSITLILYFLLGALGLPIFALGKSGIILGPTTGYLIGMCISTFVVGAISEFGKFKSWLSVFGLVLSIHGVIYFFGVIWLSFYVPKGTAISLGVVPFILGDVLKSIIASQVIVKITKQLSKNS